MDSKLVLKQTNVNESFFTKEIASTIHKQMSYPDKMVMWSWGVSKCYFCEFDNKSGLMFKVNGFVFKGWVIVLLNEGKDCYEIYTQRYMTRPEYKLVCEEVYCDNLQAVLDCIIETGDMTNEEYKKKVENAVYHI